MEKNVKLPNDRLLPVSIAASCLLALSACAPSEPTSSDDSASGDETSSDDTMAKTQTDQASDEGLCLAAGPQTPRDISNPLGLNTVVFPSAPAPAQMNLCNIHTHTNAEHKGPGFSVFVGDSDDGGYACNDTSALTEAELADPAGGDGAFKGVKPGDTIEVHWVHTSCDIEPGPTLGACLSDSCAAPLLRVEAQTFLVVNDPSALNFMDYAYAGAKSDGFHQAKAIPTGTGDPVVFLGSTTGPSYTQSACSPVQVTWSVRPQCAKVDISSLNAWAESGNVFEETKSHGVRQLVTAPELLSPIE